MLSDLNAQSEKTKIWRVVCQKQAYFKFFSMVIIKNYKVKKLFNKFPEIFRGKFPNSQPYTGHSATQSESAPNNDAFDGTTV